MDWANNSECVDIPFIDVTHEEELEIDEGAVASSYPGETPSSNPGIQLFHPDYLYKDLYCLLLTH